MGDQPENREEWVSREEKIMVLIFGTVLRTMNRKELKELRSLLESNAKENMISGDTDDYVMRETLKGVKKKLSG